MKKILLIILCTFSASSFVSAQFTIYNTANSDIGDNKVWDVECDAAGNVWLSTYDGGLTKTITPDYSNWTVYTTTNSQLSDNQTRPINKATNGEVWVGTQNAGLNYFNGTSWTSYTVSNSDIPSNTIYKIVDGPGGVIYLATKGGGLSVFNGTVFTNFDDDDGLAVSNNRVYSVATNSTNSETWVSIENQGIQKFTGSAFTTNHTVTNSQLPHNQVDYLYYDQHDDLWITTYDGLAKYDGSSWTVYTTTNSQIPGDWVRQVKMDDDGINLYVATLGGFGILNTQNDTWQIFNTANSNLPSDSCYTVDIDNEGNILVGTYAGGLAKMDKPSSISENKIYNFPLYPNPTNGLVTLNLSGIDAKNAVVSVYDFSGKLLSTEWVNNPQTKGKHLVDLSSSSSGIYFIRIDTDNKMYSSKVIKQ
jgi:hypothetical protein